jgi:hypothetical protein
MAERTYTQAEVTAMMMDAADWMHRKVDELWESHRDNLRGDEGQDCGRSSSCWEDEP